jgi:hypothetical protein
MKDKLNCYRVDIVEKNIECVSVMITCYIQDLHYWVNRFSNNPQRYDYHSKFPDQITKKYVNGTVVKVRK